MCQLLLYSLKRHYLNSLSPGDMDFLLVRIIYPIFMAGNHTEKRGGLTHCGSVVSSYSYNSQANTNNFAIQNHVMQILQHGRNGLSLQLLQD